MNRRDLLRGASAFALSAGLPAPRLSYLRSVVAEWGCDGLGPVTTTKAQMDACARWSDLTHFYANSPGMDIAHLLPGTGLLNEPLAIPRAPVPAGVTDWRQATLAEIVDDIQRFLWEHEPLGLEEPR